MNRWFERACFFLLFVFAFFGVFVSMITFHELSHWNDFKDTAVFEDELCVLNVATDLKGFWSGPAGYYKFRYYTANATELDEIKDIEVYTEAKGYTISVIVAVVFMVVILVVLWRRQELIFKEQVLNGEIELPTTLPSEQTLPHPSE